VKETKKRYLISEVCSVGALGAFIIGYKKRNNRGLESPVGNRPEKEGGFYSQGFQKET
jgi:hypothetical protein